MDTMKPRIIHANDGMIDASKIIYVETVERISLSEGNLLFRFYIGTDGRVFMFTSSDQSELEEIRSRMIAFVWPNAEVFMNQPD